MSADSPPRGGPPAATPQSPISAITSEIAMHLGRANSLLASPSKSGNPGRVATPRVRRDGQGQGLGGASSQRLDFSEKFSEEALGAAPESKAGAAPGLTDSSSSAEIARLSQIIERLSNTVEAQQRENSRLRRETQQGDENHGRSTEGASSQPSATAASSSSSSSSPTTTEAKRAARGMGPRRGSIFGRRETLAGVRELLSMEKKNLILLTAFGVIAAAILAKLLLTYEEDPLY